jgi:hypothetical protein
MDQKLLVSHIKPVIQSLENEGLKMTRVEVWPGDINGYFTLAISAEWPENLKEPRVLLVSHKVRAMIPHDVAKYIVNIYTFDTPESIEKYIDYYVTGRDYFRVQSLYPPKLEGIAA